MSLGRGSTKCRRGRWCSLLWIMTIWCGRFVAAVVVAEKMEKSCLTPDIGDSGDRVLQRLGKG
uniref:Uncharacterized protein n=1 Tax=Arundo donax TaxID=35708 RepID=A0A0A9B362_ARUDO